MIPRDQILRAASSVYHRLYETDNMRILNEEETLQSLDAYNPDQTYVLQWAESTGVMLGIKKRLLNVVYSIHKNELEKKKDTAQVKDLIDILAEC